MSDLFGDDKNDKNSGNDFAKMFEASFGGTGVKLNVGDKINCEILSIGKDEAFVSTGTLNDGMVLRSDLLDENGQLNYKTGDMIQLFVTHAKGSDIRLSTKPTAKNLADDLEDAFDMMLAVEGRVIETCNGGFRVSIMGKTAFCPISQIDIKRVEKPEDYVGKKFEFKITQLTEKGKNIIVSRRQLLEEEKELSQATFTDANKVGDVVDAIITRLEKFGAFAELAPGIEGLIHISELSWSRVSDPVEVVQPGLPVKVKILDLKEDGGRLKISLSVKQVSSQPWDKLPSFIQVGGIVDGKVTRCMKFGAFVQIAPGIEGLVPLNEMSNEKRILNAEEVLKPGDKIKVLIKEIKLEDQRISLSLKDAQNHVDSEVLMNVQKSNKANMGTFADLFKNIEIKKK